MKKNKMYVLIYPLVNDTTIKKVYENGEYRYIITNRDSVLFWMIMSIPLLNSAISLLYLIATIIDGKK